ncbi:hypothetical protein YB2330_001776 [Saitoella coloradoensis]
MSFPQAFTAANRSRVASLYRRSLKLSLDWVVDHGHWRRYAMLIREDFEANKNVTDPRRLADIFAETEAKLKEYRHPDPYIPPTAPNGTKWERNMPPLYGEQGPVKH